MLNEIVLASRYRLLCSLGKGAFGKTYLAQDTLLPGEPKCVVKQLNPQMENGDYLHLARRLFKQEAEALHKLGHWDKIPTLYAYFEQEREFYLVQQYIPGNPLSTELTPGNIWTEAQVVQLLEEVLHTLDFIHSQSVIHRDIKPSNLIRRQSDKKIVLVDFGAVKEVIISQTNIDSNLTIGIGTKGYMSSEQIRGKPRFNSDIYALGIIGIQALTGLNPNEFIEDEDGEIIWKDRVNAAPKLVEIISNMTRYHFQERYQSAREVLQALESQFEELLTVAEQTEFIADDTSIGDETSWLYLPIQNSTMHIKNRDNFLKKSDLSTNNLSQSFLWKKGNRKYLIPIFAVLLVFVAVPVRYVVTYNNSQKQQWVDLNLEWENLTISEKKPYRECLAHYYVEKIQKQQGGLKEKGEIQASCKLSLAQKLAKQKKYVRSLEITLEVKKNGFYNERKIQKQIDLLSEKILELATGIYQQEGDIEKASNLLDKIPKNARGKFQALDLVHQWTIETTASKNLLKEATEALEAERWQQAKTRAEEILNINKSKKWQAEASKIIIIAEGRIAKKLLEGARTAIEKENWREARRLAIEVKKNGVEGYIAEAEQIIEKTSQKIQEQEPGNNRPVFGCDRGLDCTQLY